MTLTTAIEYYVEYLQHEIHATTSTRLGYTSYLRRFHRYLTGRNGTEPNLEAITTDDVRSYLYTLSRQGLRPRTLRTAMYPLRGLFAMAMARGYRPDNPARAVKLPKKDAAIRETVSDEELEQLLAGCERTTDPVRRSMLKALLSVLIFAGVRRQELLDLQVGDIDLKEKRLLVRSGKGGKSRSLFLCQQCVDAVREWLAVRPRARHSYLFLVDTCRRLGEVGLVALIEQAKSLADLRDHGNIKPHAMRHAAATRLLRNGADLRSIQQFLGHSQLQTTAVYLHTDEQQLQRIAELGGFQSDDVQANRSASVVRPRFSHAGSVSGGPTPGRFIRRGRTSS